jgi:hypothetical protein
MRIVKATSTIPSNWIIAHYYENGCKATIISPEIYVGAADGQTILLRGLHDYHLLNATASFVVTLLYAKGQYYR